MGNVEARVRDVCTILFLIVVVFGIRLFLPDVPEATENELKSWNEYMQVIHHTVSEAWKNHSLGTTKNGDAIEEVAVEHFSRSLKIVITSFFLALTFGIWKGIFDFRKRKPYQKLVGEGLTSFLSALPDFFVILCLQWIILFYVPFISWFGHEEWYSFLLPSVLVALYPLLYVAKVTTSALNEESDQVFVAVARSKGLIEKIVTYKHILRNSMVQIISHLPSIMVYVLSNLLIVEWLTEYKGAAYRLFQTVDKKNVMTKLSGADVERVIETGMILELALGFMLLYFVSILVSKFLLRIVSPFYSTTMLVKDVTRQLIIIIPAMAGVSLFLLYII
ncbi:ABC transporter permease subunit [Bacillus sp. 1P02SD]|uniref:ABC transporter permease subunit n=1 Tax=Bacillus sp. 1P02SD TaxID=3132264 RepID=UPI0039A20809